MADRVKFWDKNDLSISCYLDKMEEVFDRFLRDGVNNKTFLDIIELENSVKIFELGNYHTTWSDDYIQHIESVIPIFKKYCQEFCGRATESDISQCILKLKEEYDYRDKFFEIFSKYDYAKRLSEDKFEILFWESGVSLHYLLRNNYFYKSYLRFMNEAFLSKTSHIEIVLSNYTGKEKNYFIPDKIPKEEWDSLLDDYINDELSNLNYLSLLLNPIKALGKQYFEVSKIQKLRIRKRLEAFNSNFNEDNTSLHVIFEVFFDKKAFERKKVEYKEQSGLEPKEIIDKSFISSLIASAENKNPDKSTLHMTSLVDREWIIENQNINSLLNYLLTDPDIFSQDNRLLLPTFPNKEMLGGTRSIGVRTRDSYIDSQFFQIKNKQISYKIIAYQKVLGELNLSIEKITEWFFFGRETSINWLSFSFSPKEDAIENKISTIFKNEESLRKQYQLLLEHQSIDKDLYNIINVSPNIAQLPSFIDKKYAYVTENEIINDILHFLFSDQSRLTYVNEKLNAKTFTELIENNEVRIGDFLEYQKPNIQFLINHHMLFVKEDGSLYLTNKIAILRDLYWYSEINYFLSSDEEKTILDELFEMGMVYFDSSLFSKNESDYLNFLLNNSQFDNSWAIRNKYLHGSPIFDNEQEYYHDYSFSLLILIIYMAKIDEELQGLKVLNTSANL